MGRSADISALSITERARDAPCRSRGNTIPENAGERKTLMFNIRQWWKLSGIASLALALFGAVLPTFAQGVGNTPQATILSTTSNTATSPGTLTITGQNFGDAVPSIALDGTALQVASFTDTVLVAFLPNNLAPGSYQLEVTTQAKKNNIAEFDATIGAAGPRGLPGLKAYRVRLEQPVLPECRVPRDRPGRLERRVHRVPRVRQG
jgi:hypothetical protein